MVVFPDGSMMLRSERFAEFGVRNGIPAVSGWAEFARRGNLMSYGPNVLQVYRRLASFIDRVLRGAKPGELPVELPTLIEHIINLRSARALGLTIPRAGAVAGRRTDRVTHLATSACERVSRPRSVRAPGDERASRLLNDLVRA
jgi:putative ABC transport system substrate-binding protein